MWLKGYLDVAVPPHLLFLDGGVLELKHEKRSVNTKRDTKKYVLKKFSTMSLTISLYTLSVCVI